MDESSKPLKGSLLIQYAALPLKKVENQLQVLLVTSRETKRWILPKGRPEKKVPARNVAAQEAYEEAGVVGQVSAKSIGGFPSVKRLRSGKEVATWVRVFLLDVDTELDDWPERNQRDRCWVPLKEAIGLVSEQGLALFLQHFTEGAG